MTIIQALIIGVIYYIGSSWIYGVAFQTFYRPLVNGFLVGLVLGDPITGTIIGATVNLVYLGFISAGGSIPGDPALAGVVATAIGITSDLSAQTALSLAVPLGLVGTLLWVFRMSFTTLIVQRFDILIEKKKIKSVTWNNFILPQLFLFVISVVPVSFAVLYGPDVVENALKFLGGNVVDALAVIGGMMPALGIALNMKAIIEKKNIIFYFFGFFLAAYLELDIIAVGAFAVVVAFIYSQYLSGGISNEQ